MKNGISLCMIVKNEERFLAGCLESVQGIVDEIIIVDTGSTDSTPDIARQYTEKIYHFDWIDDFSAARNFAKSKAGYEWILSLDADERLTDVDVNQLREMLQYSIDAFDVTIINKQAANSITQVSLHQAIRLFRNSEKIYFKNRVHEDVSFSLREINAKVEPAPFSILHLGYQEISESKKRFLLKLLEKEFHENPEDFATCFYYANQLFISGEYEQAGHIFERAEKLFQPKFHAKKLFCELKIRKAYAAMHCDKSADAIRELEELLRSGADCHHQWYYLLLMGDIYQNCGLIRPALECYLKLDDLLQQQKDMVQFIQPGELYLQLGNLFYQKKEIARAYQYYKKAQSFLSDSENLGIPAGMCALMLGKTQEAGQQFNRVLQINPANQTAQKGMKIIHMQS